MSSFRRATAGRRHQGFSQAAGKWRRGAAARGGSIGEPRTADAKPKPAQSRHAAADVLVGEASNTATGSSSAIPQRWRTTPCRRTAAATAGSAGSVRAGPRSKRGGARAGQASRVAYQLMIVLKVARSISTFGGTGPARSRGPKLGPHGKELAVGDEQRVDGECSATGLAAPERRRQGSSTPRSEARMASPARGDSRVIVRPR